MVLVERVVLRVSDGLLGLGLVRGVLGGLHQKGRGECRVTINNITNMATSIWSSRYQGGTCYALCQETFQL